MRIISGTHRQRRIVAPKNLPVRPTTDMAKESLFNILNNDYYFDEIRVADLCAGSGNISYEFASRGSEMILAVEKNPACARFIQETSEKFGFNQIQVLRSDIFDFLNKTKLSFDIIFTDPPYEMEGVDTIADIVFEKKLIEEGGLLIIEHSQAHDFSEHPNFVQHRKYSSVHFSFFSVT